MPSPYVQDTLVDNDLSPTAEKDAIQPAVEEGVNPVPAIPVSAPEITVPEAPRVTVPRALKRLASFNKPGRREAAE